MAGYLHLPAVVDLPALASTHAVLADSDAGKGSPIGFFVVLVLVIAVYFLYRSMNRHIKRVPDEFADKKKQPHEPS